MFVTVVTLHEKLYDVITVKNDLSCIITKDGISFPRKNMILFFRWKVKGDLSLKKYMKI